nr:MAG TPA: hypothetical protein [Caudoviricetes sp.]
MQLRKPVFKDSTEMCCLFFCLFYIKRGGDGGKRKV